MRRVLVGVVALSLIAGSAGATRRKTKSSKPHLAACTQIADNTCALPPLTPANVRGLAEYLAPRAIQPDAHDVARILWQKAWPRFLQMENDWSNYRPDPDYVLFPHREPFKAAAVCIENPDIGGTMSFFETSLSAHVSAWGTSSRNSTQEAADAAALAQCATAKTKYGDPSCVCRIVATGNGPLTEPPAEWSSMIPDLFATIEQKKLAWLKASSYRYSLVDAKAAGYDHTSRESTSRTAAVRLRAPKPLRIGYPDDERDYASACHDRLSYGFVTISADSDLAKKTLKKLNDLDLGRLYGCYNISVDTVKNPTTTKGRPTERQCRYVDHITITALPSQATFPQPWEAAVPIAQIKELWVEAVVRVSDANIPLEKRDLVRPLALRTDQALLLGVEVTAPEPDGGCYVSKPFRDKVFDFTRCAEPADCGERALSKIFDALQRRLSTTPFGATLAAAQDLAPGEMRMERLEKPSLILGGAYYELSTYTINTWAADRDNPYGSLYGRSRFRGLTAKDARFLFLRLEHIYTVSKNRLGTFREPTDDEIREYEANLKNLVPSALQEVCGSLNGWSFIDNVCVYGK